MCSNVDGSQGHWAKWKMPVSSDHVLCNKFKNVLARWGLRTGPIHNSLLIWELNIFAFLEQCIKIEKIILQIYHQLIITYRMFLNATQKDMNRRGSPTVNIDAPGVRMPRNKINILKGRFPQEPGPGSSGKHPQNREHNPPSLCDNSWGTNLWLRGYRQDSGSRGFSPCHKPHRIKSCFKLVFQNYNYPIQTNSATQSRLLKSWLGKNSLSLCIPLMPRSHFRPDRQCES